MSRARGRGRSYSGCNEIFHTKRVISSRPRERCLTNTQPIFESLVEAGRTDLFDSAGISHGIRSVIKELGIG